MGWLCAHHMVPADVCDAQDPVSRASGGPEIDETVAASPSVFVGRLERLGQRLRRCVVGQRARSSIGRLYEHHMVPYDVYDA